MARGISRVLYNSQYTQPRAIFFIHTSIGGALGVILYFLVVWLGETFYSTQTAAGINKCFNNLFLVLEQTNNISLGSFSDLQC